MHALLQLQHCYQQQAKAMRARLVFYGMQAFSLVLVISNSMRGEQELIWIALVTVALNAASLVYNKRLIKRYEKSIKINTRILVLDEAPLIIQSTNTD